MSRALTSHYELADHYYPLHNASYALLQAALTGQGYNPEKYAILKPACPGPYTELECRKASWVNYYLHFLALGFDIDSAYDINQCETSSGSEPDPSGALATLTTALAGANNDLTFTSRPQGLLGNALKVAYVNGGASQPLTVTVAAQTITVHLSTDASSVITSTANQVAGAIAANQTAAGLVRVKNAPANTGVGLVTILAVTPLTGGAAD